MNKVHILVFKMEKQITNMASDNIQEPRLHNILFWPFLASGNRPSFGEIFESWKKNKVATINLLVQLKATFRGRESKALQTIPRHDGRS